MFSRQMIAVDNGLLDHDGIVKLLDRYLDGMGTASYKEVFGIYCLEIWMRRFESYIAEI